MTDEITWEWTHKTTVTLRQIGRVRLPTSTTCARCKTPDVVLAIKGEDGTTYAYCAACAALIDDERTMRPKTTQLEMFA